MIPELLAVTQRAKRLAGTTADYIRHIDARRAKSQVRQLTKEHPMASGLLFIAAVMFCGCEFIIPPQGRIIAVGPEIRQAFDLLQSTPTGQKIISRARHSTKGAPVFLLYGSTDGCSIRDAGGDTVSGLTHVSFKSYCQTYTTDGIMVYTNKDIAGHNLKYRALVLAFELENVVYSMKFPDIVNGQDSPEAEGALEKVAMEFRR
jgi:hypothetical protein